MPGFTVCNHHPLCCELSSLCMRCMRMRCIMQWKVTPYLSSSGNAQLPQCVEACCLSSGAFNLRLVGAPGKDPSLAFAVLLHSTIHAIVIRLPLLLAWKLSICLSVTIASGWRSGWLKPLKLMPLQLLKCCPCHTALFVQLFTMFAVCFAVYLSQGSLSVLLGQCW
jgi:hypothetical protein